MVDITHKRNTLRYAKARAIVTTSAKAISLVQKNQIPKGDIKEMSKAAALLGIKQTPALLPDCHPIPVEYAAVSHSIEGEQILIDVEVKTVYKTGVEVEAMHGASVAALTIYDMLKPVEPATFIGEIKLLEKTGGKTDFNFPEEITASVIRLGTMVANGTKEDKVEAIVKDKLLRQEITLIDYTIVPDEAGSIGKAVSESLDRAELIIVVGGTGPSTTDVTTGALRPMLTKELPGIGEMIRSYGQDRSLLAYLSSSFGGFIGSNVVVAIPSGEQGVRESLDAIFPQIKQMFKTVRRKANVEG